MGADITTLGMAVDSSPVRRASDDLDRMAEAGEGAATGVTRMEGSMTGAVLVANQLDRAIAKTVDTVFSLAKGFIELGLGVGNYKDIAEKTGSTDPAGLASLRTSADVAGTSVDSVAGAINRMALQLSRAGEDKGAGLALRSINIELDTFKRLDPVTQYRTLATALDGFADSQRKVQVVQAITGRGGAEQLVMLKELAGETEQHNLLTAEQIILADELSDRMARSRSQLRQTFEVLAVQTLPALQGLTEALSDATKELLGLDKGAAALQDNSDVARFAENAVSALGFVIDAGDGVARVFRVIGTALAANATIAESVLSGEFRTALEIARQARSDIDSILNESLFSERLETALKRARAAAGSSTPNSKPEIAFDPAAAAAAAQRERAASKMKDEYAELIKNLERKLVVEKQEEQLGRELSAGEKERIEVYDRINQFKKAITESGLAAVDALLEETDALRRANAERAAEAKWLAESGRENDQRLDRERQRAQITEQLVVSAEEELAAYGKTDEQLRQLEVQRLRDAAASMRQKVAYDEFNPAQTSLNDLYRQQADALDRAAAAQERLVRAQRVERTSGSEGALRALEAYRQRTEELGVAVEDVVGRSISDLEDALVGAAMTGELSWKRLINSMIQEALRLAVIRPLLNGLFNVGMSWLSGGGSSVGASSASFNTDALTNPVGKAGGGDVDPFSVHEVNERGFETVSTGGKTFLMMGASAGKVTPSEKVGGTTIQLTYAPVTNIDARTDQAQISAAMARLLRSQNEELVQQLKSMGVIAQ